MKIFISYSEHDEYRAIEIRNPCYIVVLSHRPLFLTSNPVKLAMFKWRTIE
jgi:hypothetical protein